MDPVTAAVVITEVSEPDFHFVVTVSDGTTYIDSQVAPDQNTGIDQAVAKLNVVIAALQSQKV